MTSAPFFGEQPAREQPAPRRGMQRCDLCSSPRAWLRIEEREGFDIGRQSVRILEVAHPDNSWESPGADMSAPVTSSYDVCYNGHVRESESSPGGSAGDRIKVCLLGPVGGGKSQLRETLLRTQAPVLRQGRGGDYLVRNVRLGPVGGRYRPAQIPNREAVGATRAASGEDMRTVIERGIQRLQGYDGEDDALAGFERVLRDAIRATPEGRVLSASDVDARVASWGRGRPPHLRPVNVRYSHGDQEGSKDLRLDIAFIDLPGEATDAWTDPDEEHYVGSQADVAQLHQSAHFLAVVDPLAAYWCLESLKGSPALELSVRSVAASASGWSDMEVRGSTARDVTERMVAMLTDRLSRDYTMGATLVLTKCDTIRVLLERAPADDNPLGRWSGLVPEEDHESFRECALSALIGCVGSWDERNTDPEAWGFLCSVAEADTGRQLDIVSQLLSRFSDPDAFWALAHSGAAVGDVEVARTRPVATEDAPGWWETRPIPQFSTTGTVTLPTSADTWYRGLGAHRLQMRDVVSAAVVSAVLSTMVSRNDLEQLLCQSAARFCLTSAWTRVDKKGNRTWSHQDDDAGCLQVLRHILAPSLGHRPSSGQGGA